MAWKRGQDGDPLHINLVGTVLTHHLGLTKTKQGGVHWYHNLKIVPPAKARQGAGRLRAVESQES